MPWLWRSLRVCFDMPPVSAKVLSPSGENFCKSIHQKLAIYVLKRVEIKSESVLFSGSHD